jgi:hypothetical protein
MSPDEKNWGVIAHLSALAGYLVPFGSIIGPLVVYLIKKDTMPFAREEARSALNFQITMAIPAILCIPLIFLCIGIPLLILIGLFDLVFIIVAAVKASEGAPYKYPIAFQFVKDPQAPPPGGWSRPA